MLTIQFTMTITIDSLILAYATCKTPHFHSAVNISFTCADILFNVTSTSMVRRHFSASHAECLKEASGFIEVAELETMTL